MAKEYIERDALLRDIEDSVVFSVGRGEPSAELRGAGKIVDRIRCAPAADVVDLPCKVGDIVWTLKRAWRKEDGVAPFQITNLTITQNKKGVWTKKYRAMILVDGKTRDWSHDFAFDEIGKTTFFTKEDAEKALLCGAKMDGERRDNNAAD